MSDDPYSSEDEFDYLTTGPESSPPSQVGNRMSGSNRTSRHSRDKGQVKMSTCYYNQKLDQDLNLILTCALWVMVAIVILLLILLIWFCYNPPHESTLINQLN